MSPYLDYYNKFPFLYIKIINIYQMLRTFDAEILREDFTDIWVLNTLSMQNLQNNYILHYNRVIIYL